MRTNDLNFNPFITNNKEKNWEHQKSINIGTLDTMNKKIRFSICKHWGLRNSMHWHSACARQRFSLGDGVASEIASRCSSTFSSVPDACNCLLMSPVMCLLDISNTTYMKHNSWFAPKGALESAVTPDQTLTAYYLFAAFLYSRTVHPWVLWTFFPKSISSSSSSQFLLPAS